MTCGIFNGSFSKWIFSSEFCVHIFNIYCLCGSIDKSLNFCVDIAGCVGLSPPAVVVFLVGHSIETGHTTLLLLLLLSHAIINNII